MDHAHNVSDHGRKPEREKHHQLKLYIFWYTFGPHDDYHGNAEQCHICCDTDTTKARRFYWKSPHLKDMELSKAYESTIEECNADLNQSSRREVEQGGKGILFTIPVLSYVFVPM